MSTNDGDICVLESLFAVIDGPGFIGDMFYDQRKDTEFVVEQRQSLGKRPLRRGSKSKRHYPKLNGALKTALA